MAEPMTQQQQQQWAQVVAKAWSDEAFKKRLLAQPAAVLKEAGADVPEGLQFKVVENTERLVHLILPLKPSTAELTDEQLEQVAGGALTPCLHPKPKPYPCDGCVVYCTF